MMEKSIVMAAVVALIMMCLIMMGGEHHRFKTKIGEVLYAINCAVVMMMFVGMFVFAGVMS